MIHTPPFNSIIIFTHLKLKSTIAFLAKRKFGGLFNSVFSLGEDQYEVVVQSTTGIIAFQSVMSCDGFRMHRKHEKTVAGCAIKW